MKSSLIMTLALTIQASACDNPCWSRLELDRCYSGKIGAYPSSSEGLPTPYYLEGEKLRLIIFDSGACEQISWYVNGYYVGDGFFIDIQASAYVTHVDAYSICSCDAKNFLPWHTADNDHDNFIGLSELLRVIQFYNLKGLYAVSFSEDNFDPLGGSHYAYTHDSDYNPADWQISLSEALRAIQIYNWKAGYVRCIEGEDGFCERQQS